MENNTALLVMDLQPAMTSMHPGFVSPVDNIAKAIAHARGNNIPVIYVVIGFRPGMPEMKAERRVHFANVDMHEFVQIDPVLAPLEDDIIVIKRRVSAFSGSDLELVLRVQGIQHIVLTGVATSGVVLSTLREAWDKDYRITVLSDCCKDRDEEVHGVLMTKVFPRQAEVRTVGEWTDAI
jgi:nicotinamidase-related amidase